MRSWILTPDQGMQLLDRASRYRGDLLRQLLTQCLLAKRLRLSIVVQEHPDGRDMLFGFDGDYAMTAILRPRVTRHWLENENIKEV